MTNVYRPRTHKYILLRPVEAGEMGEFSRVPRRLGPHLSKILKKVFQVASFWPQMCIKSIFRWVSAPNTAGGAYDAFQTPSRMVRMVRGHRFPCFVDLGAYRMKL